MRKPKAHAELVKTWDTETLTETIERLKQQVSDLVRDRDMGYGIDEHDHGYGWVLSKKLERPEECEIELARR